MAGWLVGGPIALTRTYHEPIITAALPNRAARSLPMSENLCRSILLPALPCFSGALSRNLNHLVLISFFAAPEARELRPFESRSSVGMCNRPRLGEPNLTVGTK